MEEIQLLTKNLSYQGSYHHRVFYPKLVYDRVLQRYTFASPKQSVGSFSLSRCSSSSLPDLVEALLHDAEEDPSSQLTGLLRRKQSSSSEMLLGDSGPVPFSTGESQDEFSSGDAVGGQGNWSAASSPSSGAAAGSSTRVESMNELELMELVRPLRRQRSSSLRRSRSRSPGQSSESLSRKAVRFADTMGFHLRSVRLFANKDMPPILPSSALSDLRKGLEEAHKSEGTRYVCACFKQPGDTSDFLERVNMNGVVLERCIVSEGDRMLTGTIRVANLSFKKSIYIRYTVNRWVTFDDISASYKLGSNDGLTDQYVFSINLPKNMSVGSRLEFAVRYDAVDIGQTFWDNNLTNNYAFECFARSVPTRESDFAWLHFL